MVAARRDVGGRCIKARGLPELSQQPEAVTEPLELGRDAPGRLTGAEYQGRAPGESHQGASARLATTAVRAKLFQPLAYCRRCIRTLF